VEYSEIKYYSGKVHCGNLLLESDIGGTHAWIPPKVTAHIAKEGSLYTLVYIDFFVDMKTADGKNATWPDSVIPGSKAPARHWVVGNIEAQQAARVCVLVPVRD